MKVFVTGSKGFIGKHLMKALGEQGVGYDLKDDWYSCNDILDYEQLKVCMKGCDIVIHLAAVSSLKEVEKDPQKALATNIIGTYNVLKAAKANKIKKVIIASSAATARPDLSLYGMSKASMELLAEYFPNTVITRFYNVYGKGGKGVVNKFIEQVKKGQPLTLNGNTTRDYIYIDDVTKKLIELLNYPWINQICELGTGKSTSLKNLAKLIMKLIGKEVKVIQSKPLKEIQQSKMDKKYKFFKAITLEEGIKRLI